VASRQEVDHDGGMIFSRGIEVDWDLGPKLGVKLGIVSCKRKAAASRVKLHKGTKCSVGISLGHFVNLVSEVGWVLRLGQRRGCELRLSMQVLVF